MTLQESYRILGLDTGASVEDVKAAFRRLALETHPDLHGGDAAAAERFRLVNAAYLTLRGHLENGGAAKPQEPRASRQQARQAYDRQQAEAQEAARRAFSRAFQDIFKDTFDAQGRSARPTAERRQKAGARADRGPQRSAGQQAKAAAGPQETSWFERSEEMLHDLFQDPYARQVFEEIYAQMGGQVRGPQPKAGPGPGAGPAPFARNPAPPAEGPAPRPRGLTGWLRRQLDVEQSLRLPADDLAPGRVVVLDLRSGFFGASRRVEVRLPADFRPGRTLRLKGLGRALLGAKGDLYLTILPA